MSIADKLATIAENQHRIYQAGYDKGKAEGGEVGDDYVVEVPSTIKTYSDTHCAGFAENAFKDFTELETVYAPHAELIGAHAFKGCSKLESVQFGNVSDVREGAFRSCVGLRNCTIHFYPKDWIPCTCGALAFENCTNLEILDLHNIDGCIYDKCFAGCSNLKALILRYDGPDCGLNNADAFDGTKIASGDGYIYVPSKCLEMYQGNNTWSTFADQIRALEDYTVDGTIYGELDETKI